jgi:hypothetical protein
MTASANQTNLAGTLTIDANQSNPDAIPSVAPTSSTLTLKHSANTSGTGQSSILFPSAINNGSDFGSITYIDSVSQWPAFNYLNTSGSENGAMVVNVQNDTNGSIEDTLVLTSAGSVIIDAGNYSSNAVPSAANKSSSNPIIMNPYTGGVAINKTAVTTGYELDISGNLLATGVYSGGTQLNPPLIIETSIANTMDYSTQGWRNRTVHLSITPNSAVSGTCTLYLARDYANIGTCLFLANFGGRTITVQSNSSFVGLSSAPSTFNLQANGIAHLMLMANKWCVLTTNTSSSTSTVFVS